LYVFFFASLSFHNPQLLFNRYINITNAVPSIASTATSRTSATSAIDPLSKRVTSNFNSATPSQSSHSGGGLSRSSRSQ
jgi:hypothetical protein